MTTQNTQATRGRPLSTRGRKVRSAVLRYVDQADQFTAREVSRATKSNKTAIRNRLNALLRSGVIQEVGTVKGEGRGRPQAVYAKVQSED